MWKPRLLYGLALLAALLLAALFPDPAVSFLLLYALLLLGGVSLLTVLSAPLFLRVGQELAAEQAFKGESLGYGVCVHNRGPLYYPRIEWQLHRDGALDYGAVEDAFALRPGKKRSTSGEIAFPYRGVYPVGVDRLTVTGYFGIFQLCWRVKQDLQAVILPQPDEEFQLSIQREPLLSSSLHSYLEDYTDVADVRKHTPSDSYKKIHWKLSAKRGEFLVKNFESELPGRTILYLDTAPVPANGPGRLSFEDRMISCAAAAVEYCIQGHLPAQLSYGDQTVPIEAYGETDRLYRMLAEIAFHGERSGFCGFARELDKGSSSLNLVLLLSFVDEELCRVLRDFVTFDHKVYLYYFSCSPVPEEQELLDSLQSCGAAVVSIAVNEETEAPEETMS